MKLVALRCPECNAPLAAENEHVVVACERCNTVVEIGDDGLRPMEVAYAEPKSAAQTPRWVPCWVFHGRVQIQRRDTQGGRSAQDEALRFWAQPRDLYVPAWELSMPKAQELGSALIQRQPRLRVTPAPAGPRLSPATCTADEAAKMLDFIVMAIEARRPDWLKDLAFELDLGAPALWALPLDEKGEVALE